MLNFTIKKVYAVVIKSGSFELGLPEFISFLFAGHLGQVDFAKPQFCKL